MIKVIGNIIILSYALFLVSIPQASAAAVNLSEPKILGSFKLGDPELKAIKKAVMEALKSPIDTEAECGEVRGDCVVRAAREWSYDGVTYREIVINIHTAGHASFTAEKVGGKWPDVTIK